MPRRHDVRGADALRNAGGRGVRGVVAMDVTTEATSVATLALLPEDATTAGDIRGAAARADRDLRPETADAAIAVTVDVTVLLAGTEVVDAPSLVTPYALRAPAVPRPATASVPQLPRFALGDAAARAGATCSATAS